MALIASVAQHERLLLLLVKSHGHVLEKTQRRYRAILVHKGEKSANDESQSSMQAPLYLEQRSAFREKQQCSGLAGEKDEDLLHQL